jgi:hypothetical protein
MAARLLGSTTTCGNDFFGEEASTRKTRDELLANVPAYQHREIDIRDAAAVNEVFKNARA